VSCEYLRVVNEHGPLVRRTESRRATSGRATGAELSSYNKPNEGSTWKERGGLWPTFTWGPCGTTLAPCPARLGGRLAVPLASIGLMCIDSVNAVQREKYKKAWEERIGQHHTIPSRICSSSEIMSMSQHSSDSRTQRRQDVILPPSQQQRRWVFLQPG
jgi:hypothetical protein